MDWKDQETEDVGTEGGASKRKAVLGWIVFLEVLCMGIAAAMMYAHRPAQDLADQNTPLEFYVQFSAAPDWVPQSLLRKLLVEMTPQDIDFRNPELTRRVYDLAAASPMIASVTMVSKHASDDPTLGVVEVEAVFRRPLAVVRQEAGDFYIDENGVVIPTRNVPKYISMSASADGSSTMTYYLDEEEIPPGARYAAIHYIAITGVESLPPLDGQKWDAPELPDAVRLMGMIWDKPWAAQITAIDMRNFGGRIARGEPYIRMYASDSQGKMTDIRFGRFPLSRTADYVIAPDRKIMYLDSYAADHGGRLAGFNSYLDLRYDQLHVSIN